GSPHPTGRTPVPRAHRGSAPELRSASTPTGPPEGASAPRCRRLPPPSPPHHRRHIPLCPHRLPPRRGHRSTLRRGRTHRRASTGGGIRGASRVQSVRVLHARSGLLTVST